MKNKKENHSLGPKQKSLSLIYQTVQCCSYFSTAKVIQVVQCVVCCQTLNTILVVSLLRQKNSDILPLAQQKFTEATHEVYLVIRRGQFYSKIFPSKMIFFNNLPGFCPPSLKTTCHITQFIFICMFFAKHYVVLCQKESWILYQLTVELQSGISLTGSCYIHRATLL